jgi:uncharacterized protein (DUF302 family)
MYAFSTEIDLPVDAAVEKLLDALRQEGMGVVSDIDVRAVMKAKLGDDIPAYRILGACAPRLAQRILAAEPEGGTLLPCNVVVRDAGGGRSAIHFLDPAALLGLSDSAEVQAVAAEARDVLDRVLARLAP